MLGDASSSLDANDITHSNSEPVESYFSNNHLTRLPKIHCGNVDCNNDLHCFYFYKSKRIQPKHERGACQGCGEHLVAWGDVQNCNILLIDEKFAQMKREWVRHYHWHADFDDDALRLARFRGRLKTIQMLRNNIERNVVALNPEWDRRNTPFKGDLVHYARHATASCCRVCIEYWHGIPRDEDRPLTKSEVDYLVELGRRYLMIRVPGLQDEPDGSFRKKPVVSLKKPSIKKTAKRVAKKRGRAWKP